MKTILKQATGLFLVFFFLTAANDDSTKVATDTTESPESPIDTIVDTAVDTTSNPTLDTIVDTLTDTISDTTQLDTTILDTTLLDTSLIDTTSADTSTTDSTPSDSTHADSTLVDSTASTAPAQHTDSLSDTSSDSSSALADDSGATDTTTPVKLPPPIELSPREQAEEHYQAAVTYSQDSKKVVEMVGELALAIKADPDYPPPYLKLGVHQYRTKNYKSAEDNLKKAAKLSPDDTVVLGNLGKLYIALRKRDDAEKLFVAAVEANKDFVGAYRELGDLYYRQKRYKESIDALEKYNSKVTDDHLSHFRAGKAYRKLKRLDKAVGEYRKALSIKLDFAQAYSALGQIYLADENFEEAIEAYSSSVQYNPKGYRSFFNLAIAIQSAYPDSLDRSLSAWRQALRMAKNNPRVTDIVPIAEIQITELEKQLKLRANPSSSVGKK